MLKQIYLQLIMLCASVPFIVLKNPENQMFKKPATKWVFFLKECTEINWDNISLLS